jgi:Concanavalin A-like lectin/glucanases superfamily/Domain of unknown function (DUF4157)
MTAPTTWLERAWESTDEGRPLPHDLREMFERGLGVDLTALRVHTGPAADAAARACGADAFACGSGVFFRDGGYRPGEARGLRLLAHEVAHVAQQARHTIRTPEPGSADDRWEAEADRFAAAVADHRSADHPADHPADHRAARPEVVVRPGPSGVVQRHSSFEHRYLGDGQTQQLVDISTRAPLRQENLLRQIKLMSLWRYDPDAVTPEQITDLCPWIRTLRLGRDNLLVTYGELNALPDYLASAQDIEQLGADILVPILQVIRQESFNELSKLAGSSDSPVSFARAANEPWGLSLVNTLVETAALETLTAGLGVGGENHYHGLLARNACHFAPYSWYRWQASHLIARDLAGQAHQAKGDQKESLTRRAWGYHGYADHFLQDSFAAGHLINKTLVMQWFVEWAAAQTLLPVPVADWNDIRYMTQALEPGLAGRQLYDPDYPGPSIDPQTSQEAATLVARALGAGLTPGRQDGQLDAYQSYFSLLTSAVAQLCSANLHDYYNGTSVWVASQRHPAGFEVWGDETLLSGANGGEGVRVTSETAQTSQQALLDILSTGGSDISTASIRARFPVRAGGDANSLQDLRQWNTGQKGWCESEIFSPFVPTLKRLLVGLASPRLGTVSRDQPFGGRWYAPLGGTATYQQASVLTVGTGVDARVFAASGGYVYELDPVNGKPLQGPVALPQLGLDPRATLAAGEGYLYAGAGARVHALPLRSTWGKAPEWSTGQLGGVTGDGPVELLSRFAPRRLFAAVNGYAYEIGPDDGAVLQNALLTSSVGAGDYSMKLTTDGERLFAGTHGYVYALPLGVAWNGTKTVWVSPHLGENALAWEPVTPLAVANRLYAVCNGSLYELSDQQGGKIVSRVLLSGLVGVGDYTASLASDGAMLYTGMHGYVYGTPVGAALNTVKPLVSPLLGESLLTYGRVSLVYRDDQLFAGVNGSVYELDLFNASVRQSAQITDAVGLGDYTTALATDGSRLYAGTHGYAYSLLRVDLEPAPRAYWPLAETSGNAVADLRGGHPATATDVQRLALGAVPGCTVFNGFTSEVSTASSVLDTGPGASFTVTAWARLDKLPANRCTVVSQDANRTSGFYLQYSAPDGAWFFSRVTSDADVTADAHAQAKAFQPLGTWTHLAGVYDAAAGQLQLYVNGALSGTAAFSPDRAFPSTGVLAIGRAKYQGVVSDRFQGAVRDVRVYQRALTAPDLAPTAAAFWRLDERSGTRAADQRGNFPASTTNVAWDSASGVGGYARFTGNSSVTAPASALYTGSGSSFTVSAWARLDRLPGNRATVVSQEADVASSFFLQYSAPDRKWAFTRVLADAVNPDAVSAWSAQVEALGVWTHLAGVWDGEHGELRLYVDAVHASTAPVRAKVALSPGSFVIGRSKYDNGNADWLNGAVRDVRLFPVALSEQLIRDELFDPVPGV